MPGGGDVGDEGVGLDAGVQDFLEQGLAGEGGGFLLEIADGQVALAGDAAGFRLGFAGQDVQQGGLAGAVGTDQGDAVAGGHVEGEAAEQGAVGVGLADVGCE